MTDLTEPRDTARRLIYTAAGLALDAEDGRHLLQERTHALAADL